MCPKVLVLVCALAISARQQNLSLSNTSRSLTASLHTPHAHEVLNLLTCTHSWVLELLIPSHSWVLHFLIPKLSPGPSFHSSLLDLLPSTHSWVLQLLTLPITPIPVSYTFSALPTPMSLPFSSLSNPQCYILYILLSPPTPESLDLVISTHSLFSSLPTSRS